MLPFRSAMFARPRTSATEPGFWQRTAYTALNTGTGTQDIAVSGLSYTPKAAIIRLSAITALGSSTDMRFSIGFTDGATTFCRGLAIAGSNYARGGNTLVAALFNAATAAAECEVAFSAWIEGGMRVNITDAPAGAYLISIEFFGGADFSAKAVSFLGATSGGTNAITGVGFQSDMIYCLSSGGATGYSTGTASLGIGMASYDGSTIRQGVSSQRYLTGGGGEALCLGEIRDNAIFTNYSSRYMSISAIGSDGFTVSSTGQDFSASTNGALCMNFGGAAEAWVGMLDTPTATGSHDFVHPSDAPSFTPVFASTLFTHFPTKNVDDSTNALAWAMGGANDNEQVSSGYRAEDALTVSYQDYVTLLAQFVYCDNDDNTASFSGTLSEMITGGVRANMTSVTGTARKMAMGLIG